MLLISKCNLNNALCSASHFKARGGGRHGMNANVKCRFLCGLRPNETFLYFQLKID